MRIPVLHVRSSLLVFLLFMAIASSAKTQELFTLVNSNITIGDVFKAIKKQTGFTVFYSNNLLNDKEKVNVNFRNAKVGDVLEFVLKDKNFSYKIQDQLIILQKKQEVKNKFVPVQSQVQLLEGRVTDQRNQPLAGVSVRIKGGNTGTSTDGDGKFSLNVPSSGSVLVFTYIGFVTREVPVNGQSMLNVQLAEETTSLKEVVVVGYGTQRRSNITSAVASVSSKSIENQPLSGLDQALAGQAAGVQAAQRTGTPGGGVTVRVRGTGSVSAGNEPLYVIDGFPVEVGYNRDVNPLSSINPNDIESIEILKDASSAAIYGSRGSNGVVLITTKRGKAGRPKVTFNSYYGTQEVANKIDMLNAREYAEFNIEARNNGWVDQGGNANDPNEVRPDRYKIPPMFMNPSSLGTGTDWQDEVFRSAAVQNYQLAVAGGTEATQYMVSGGIFNQEGVVTNTGFRRYAFRANLDSRVSDKIKIGVNLSPSYSKNDILPVEDQVFTNGILASALSMPPTIQVFNPDGTYTTQLGASPYVTGIIENPVAIAEKIQGETSANRTLGNAFAEYEIVPDLKFRTSLGIDYSESRSSNYHPSDLGRDGISAPVVPLASASDGRGITWLNENTLTYNKDFREEHNINALLGYTSQKSEYEGAYLSATNFPNDLVPTLNAGQVTSGGTNESHWSLLSFLARVNYSYKSKYLLTATVRRDGSSRFGASKKWGTFPSASAGWNIARENFLKDSKVISDLKLRVSYGLAGNNSIGNYSAIGLLSSSRYVFGTGGGSLVNGLQPSSISNADLGWEVMEQFDVGLDVSLFQNRVSFVVDYYNKNTSDLLLNVPVPSSTGFTSALQNIGKVNNKGMEFALNTKNLVNNFRWSTDFNIAFNKNKVVALGPSGDPIISRSPSFSPNTHITQIGSPMGSFYGYEAIGVYKNLEDVQNSPAVAGATGSRPGDLKFRDINGDGTITAADVTIIGDNNPDFTYGLTNNFSFKNFSLSVLVDGAQGFELLNGSRRNIGLVSGSYSRKDVLGRWQSPENPGDGKTPRANVTPTGGNVTYVSSLLVEDASFLRIRNINLRYNLPQKLFNKLPLENASLSFGVQNAFTFTDYLGYNPEQSFQGASPLTPGVDFNGYPVARTYTLGINVTFK